MYFSGYCAIALIATFYNKNLRGKKVILLEPNVLYIKQVFESYNFIAVNEILYGFSFSRVCALGTFSFTFLSFDERKLPPSDLEFFPNYFLIQKSLY